MSFNAWETDFMDDPFLALCTEVIGDKKNEATTKKCIQNIIKHTTFGSLKLLVSQLPAGGTLKETLNVIQNIVSTDGIDVNEYTKLKQNIENFKNILADIISDEKPIVFIIDELDRCKPTYAIALLERVKHLFSIDNIVFIFGIDREQLSHSIQTVYGSVDSNGYLKRFFDIEIDLPKPDIHSFVKNEIRQRNLDYTFGNYISNLICPLLTGQDFSIRDINKLFTRIKYTMFPDNNENNDILIVLLSFKIKNENLYKSIKNKEISGYELMTKTKNYFKADFQYSDEFLYANIWLGFCFFLGHKKSVLEHPIEKQIEDIIENFIPENAGNQFQWTKIKNRYANCNVDYIIKGFNSVIDRVELISNLS